MALPLAIDKVWTRVGTELQEEIITFWKTNQLLPPDADAVERARQVVFVVRNEGRIVGLTSAALVKYARLNNNLFFAFRMAVLPQFRIPGVESKLLVETRDFLEAYTETQSANKAIGILAFVENPNLRANRNEAVWPASKMVYIGNDTSGRHIRVYYFKNVRI